MAKRERAWLFVTEMLFHGLLLAEDVNAARKAVPQERLPLRRIEPLCEWIAIQDPLHLVWRAEAEARMKNSSTFHGDCGIRETLLVEPGDHTVPEDLSKFDADAVHHALLEQAVVNGDNASAAGLELKGCGPWVVPSLHSIQDRLREEMRRMRRCMLATNFLMVALNACAVAPMCRCADVP